MQVNSFRLNSLLSTLNFVLCFVGYGFFTSLFLPVSSDIENVSRSVTIPYRAFALFISLLVIFLNLRTKVKKPSITLQLFLFYWGALLVRIFYDLYIRSDVFLVGASQIWFYIFGMVIPAMISIMISYKNININRAFLWIYISIGLIIILSLFNNSSFFIDSQEIMNREGGNLAFNAISFGHLGTTGVLLSIFALTQLNLSFIKKIISITVLLLSLFAMIRSASRSPIIALFGVILFWLFAQGNKRIWSLLIVISVIISIVTFINPILDFIGNISPVMEHRLRISIFEGDSSGRDSIFKDAIKAFLDSPIIGKQFGLFDGNGGYGYSHNIILDSLMGLGIFGGLIIIFILWKAIKKSYTFIQTKNPNYWVFLILLQQIILVMFSGAIYYELLLNSLLVYALLMQNSLNSQSTQVLL